MCIQRTLIILSSSVSPPMTTTMTTTSGDVGDASWRRIHRLIDSSFGGTATVSSGRNLINQRLCLWCGAYQANLINEPRLAFSASNSLDRNWIRRRRRGIFNPLVRSLFNDPLPPIIVYLSQPLTNFRSLIQARIRGLVWSMVWKATAMKRAELRGKSSCFQWRLRGFMGW